jgi:uncharacterized membrane protein YedE/YeeE
VKAIFTAFVSGVLFAAGLVISGMTDAVKVTGFLDVTGAWDPSLAFVMGAALAVHVVPVRLLLRRGRPWFDTKLHLPVFHDVDARLVGGAALFGIGWGLVGYCPGPAIVSAAGGLFQGGVFTLAMLGGMALFHATVPSRVPDEPHVPVAAPDPAI